MVSVVHSWYLQAVTTVRVAAARLLSKKKIYIYIHTTGPLKERAVGQRISASLSNLKFVQKANQIILFAGITPTQTNACNQECMSSPRFNFNFKYVLCGYPRRENTCSKPLGSMRREWCNGFQIDRLEQCTSNLKVHKRPRYENHLAGAIYTAGGK